MSGGAGSGEPLLRASGLTVGLRRPGGAAVGGGTILDGIDLTLDRGATLGLVGESGCGKSTLLLALLGYSKPNLALLGGSVRFDGQELVGADAASLRRLRARRIGYVPQIAAAALTPTLTIGRHLDEAFGLAGIAARERRQRALELLEQVRLPTPDRLLARFPHQLSGGQQQRVAIAMALAGQPDLVLLDEPTTALDPTTRVQILALLRELIAARGTAMIYVSHDLGVIAAVAERLAVMYAGQIVEQAPTAEALARPEHPYLAALLGSAPRLAATALPRAIPGAPPAPGQRDAACRFRPRCGFARAACAEGPPPLRAPAPGRSVRCLGHEGMAPAPPALPPRPFAAAGAAPLVTVEGLCLRYGARLVDRLAGRKGHTAVEQVGFTLAPGRTLGLVGESGSGKSTILKAIAGLLPVAAGRLGFAGQDITAGVMRRPPDLRRRIQLIFQNPEASLNPRRTVREILGRPLSLYFGLSAAAAEGRIRALAESVRLTARHLDQLPAQLSGGEKQRVAIARAFAAEPDLILADEITSALDVSVQAAILALIAEMTAVRGCAMIVVSHDLPVVKVLADEMIVLERGRVLESGRVSDLFAAPRMPTTRALIEAVLEPT